MENQHTKELKEMTPKALEALLESLEPAKVSDESFERMLSALETPAVVEKESSKIIGFQASKPSAFDGYTKWDALKDRVIVTFDNAQQSLGSLGKVATYAATIVLALFLAWNHSGLSNESTSFYVNQKAEAPSALSKIIPASQKTMLAGINQGVVWDHNQQPHMCVKVEKIQLIPVKTAGGAIEFIKKPKVDYYFTPCILD